MRIAVFGCGYVGLTTAVGFAELGNEVIGVDNDRKKLGTLQKGLVPFFEPGMKGMLAGNVKSGRLRFTGDAKSAIEKSEIIICAVGTPPKKDSGADFSAVLKVAEEFAKYAYDGKIFVNKSTVPLGTNEAIIRLIEKESRGRFKFRLFSNPEFLREGSALNDFFKPDRIIVGMEFFAGASEKEKALIGKEITLLHKPMIKSGATVVYTDLRSAECVKYASNAYLAARISFINEMANFCEKAGANVKEVARGVGLDKRIGTHFLDAGIGFGGSCLPKDLSALINMSKGKGFMGKGKGFDFRLLKAVQEINRDQPLRVVQKLKAVVPKLRGKKVAVWGLAFKPNTDDMRDAPSIPIIKQLLRYGVKVQVFDPAAEANARVIFGETIKYYSNPCTALADTEALLILTEWDCFRKPDFKKMKALMRNHYIIDGRNVLDPQEALDNRFLYLPIGRG
jgi:UDPglucose 6-dehydrogenase